MNTNKNIFLPTWYNKDNPGNRLFLQQSPLEIDNKKIDLTGWLNTQIADGDIHINFLTGDLAITGDLGITGDLVLTGLPVHANEAAAIVAALVTGTIYQTVTGEVRVKL